MPHSVLIIGCGAIAGGYDSDRSSDGWPLSHAGALTQNDRFDLIACVDPDDDVRHAFVERWTVPVSAASLDTLGGQPGDYDVIVIASPTQFHAEHLQTALKMNPKLVFCEKPLAGDLELATQIARDFETAGVQLAVNYSRRWASSFAFLLGEIKLGDWGELISGACAYTKGIVHNGSHMVDLLQLLLGPLTLHSVGPARLDHWDDDPTASAILNDPTGAPIHLIGCDARAVTQFELELNFERGQFAMRNGGARIEKRATAESDIYPGYREFAKPTGVEEQPDSMKSAWWNIYKALEGDAPLASSAENALSAQRLCEEIRRKALDNMKKDAE